MDNIETLVKIFEVGHPVIGSEVGLTAVQLKALEAKGLLERPKSEPNRKTGQRGRPAAQYRLTDRARGRVRRHLAAVAKGTKTVPVEVAETVNA